MNPEEFKKLTVECCKKAIETGYKICSGLFYVKDSLYCCPLTAHFINSIENDIDNKIVSISDFVFDNISCSEKEAESFYTGFDDGANGADGVSSNLWYRAGFEVYEELINLGIEVK